MDTEYQIKCPGVGCAELIDGLRGLPSPIQRPEMREIYNYRVESDGYYFVDRGVAPAVAAVGMRHLIDSALSKGASRVTIEKL
ncbi:hypothetical protein GALL_161490 [mine drainage metagenome]|uniref:Uncharacterized protein n=1 Tax=mine drainage metagenome TaxID=410659 RepID=A0A1J5S0W2_9ZZZZ